MKRYLLFTNPAPKPQNPGEPAQYGWDNFAGDYDTATDATLAATTCNLERVQVVDTQTMQLVVDK